MNTKRQAKLQKQLAKKQSSATEYDEAKVGLAQAEEFSVAHLMNQLTPAPHIDRLMVHYNRVSTRAKVVQEPEQKRDRDAQQRKITAMVMKKNLKKWLPIVKHNREADHIDFTKTKNVPQERINNSDTLKHNPIAQEIENELKKSKLNTEEQVRQMEVSLTANPESKKALVEQQQQLAKKTSLAFHQELKNKRIAKIKSKVYHRIKKKHSEKEKLKLMAQLNPYERQKEIEKLKEERARERVTLRHSTKNKFTQSLMRFGGDKQSLQQQQNFLNTLRQQLLKKAEGQFDEEDMLDQLDDEEFKNQAIIQLEQELLNIENQEQEKGVGLKFLERQKTETLSKSKSQVLELIKMLKSGEYKPDADEEEQEEKRERLSWENSEDDEKKPQPEAEVVKADEEFQGRGKFVKEVTDRISITVGKPKSIKKVTADNVTKEFLEEDQRKKEPTKKEVEKQQLNELKEDMNEQQKLLQGLNFGNLKAKYKKVKTTTINQTDDQILRENLNNFVMNFDEEENEEGFLKQKLTEMEAQLPDETAPLKGWGSWAGFGIKQKKPPSKEEILQRKISKIKEIQKKRKDAVLEHVIINEKRETAFSKFLVKELPHEYQTKEQFEYMNSQAIGPEWNSYRGHQDIVKPRVITKAGHIINPVQVPRKKQKLT